MSTTAIIKLEGCNTAKVYKHWDGDTKYTLPWLKDFNKDFVQSRGDDDDYKLAQLVRSAVFDGNHYGLDMSRHTGWGIVPMDSEYDGEYEYILMKDGSVKTIRH